MAKNNEDKISILLLGNSFVGKTSITKKFTSGVFFEKMMGTVGVDYCIKNVKHKNKNYSLKIWDTAGQERYQHISRQLVRKADGIIFVYDISDYKTFSDLIDCFEVCKEENNLTNIGTIMVGNKADLEEERQVFFADAQAQANMIGLNILEVSALNGQNIEKCFLLVLKEVLKIRKLRNNYEEDPNSFTLDTSVTTEESEGFEPIRNEKKCAC